MSDYGSIQREDRRLVILRALAREPDYSINERVLKAICAQFGHGVSADVLASDLAWLAEQDLIRTEIVGDNLTVARITSRGIDVADGHAVVPGVRHPRPGE